MRLLMLLNVHMKAKFEHTAFKFLEVEKKLAEYLEGTAGAFETVQITKSKIEAVIY